LVAVPGQEQSVPQGELNDANTIDFIVYYP